MNTDLHKRAVRVLYKTILKLHRGLPADLQALGSVYVKDEFKRHKTCDAQTAVLFLNEWTEYALSLSKQMTNKAISRKTKVGRDLNEDFLQKMREDQVVQLYELMRAAKNLEQES